MSNVLKRPKHKEFPDFAVRFIGYSGGVVAHNGNVKYATVDFVSEGQCFSLTKVGFPCGSSSHWAPLLSHCRVVLVI